MKITKLSESGSCGADSNSSSGGSYCDGNYGEPTGHLDSQIFPCKEDPSVETSKKRKKKKKKAFNLQELKLAQTITGPDMESITPDKIQEAREWLRNKYPNINWTIEKVSEWINEHFSNKLKPMTGPKDVARRPLD